jgi:NADH-quinone oxidoreductase subunit G
MKQCRMRSADSMRSFDEVMEEMAAALPLIANVRDISPPGDFTIQGMKIPRQTHRFSGRTALTANETVHEPKPLDDPDFAMSFSMEGYLDMPPAPFTARYWSPGWNSVQSITSFPQTTGDPATSNDAGTRLVEPAANARPSYFPVNHENSIVYQQGDQYTYHIFGSDELSMHAPSISEIAKTRKTESSGKT